MNIPLPLARVTHRLSALRHRSEFVCLGWCLRREPVLISATELSGHALVLGGLRSGRDDLVGRLIEGAADAGWDIVTVVDADADAQLEQRAKHVAQVLKRDFRNTGIDDLFTVPSGAVCVARVGANTSLNTETVADALLELFDQRLAALTPATQPLLVVFPDVSTVNTALLSTLIDDAAAARAAVVIAADQISDLPGDGVRIAGKFNVLASLTAADAAAAQDTMLWVEEQPDVNVKSLLGLSRRELILSCHVPWRRSVRCYLDD